MSISWLFLVFLVELVISVLLGYHYGFLRSVWALASFFVAILLSTTLNPMISQFLTDTLKVNTYIEGKIEERIDSDFLDKVNIEGNFEQQEEFISTLNIPSSWKKYLNKDNTESIYEDLGINSFKEYLVKEISFMIIKIIGFLLTFVMVMLILRIISYILKLVQYIPLLGSANQICGGVYGVLRAVCFLWIFYLFLMLFSSSVFSGEMMNLVSDNIILKFLYQYNLLTWLILL